MTMTIWSIELDPDQEEKEDVAISDDTVQMLRDAIVTLPERRATNSLRELIEPAPMGPATRRRFRLRVRNSRFN